MKELLNIGLMVMIMSCAGQVKQDLALEKLSATTVPEMKPYLFSPNLISDPASNERDISIDPKRGQLVFSRNGNTMFTNLVNGQWITPILAPFASDFLSMEAQFSLDGNTLYFISRRPYGSETTGTWQMWSVKKTDDGWGLTERVNDKGDFYFSMTHSGKIYFTDKNNDIYYALESDSGLVNRVKLSETINTAGAEYNAFVDPDETYIIFSGHGRMDGYGSGDLYISFKNEAGMWSIPKNMGPGINSSSMDYCPYVSPDGKYLFFTSRRSGNSDIYWVSTRVIDELKVQSLNFIPEMNAALELNAQNAEKYYTDVKKLYAYLADYDGSQLESVARNQILRKQIHNVPIILQLIQKKHPDYKKLAIEVELAALNVDPADLNDLSETVQVLPKNETNGLENVINVLGYTYLQNKELVTALKLFDLNVSLFQDSFNVWDSYGEGLLAYGDTVNSILAYEKSLELNSKNNNAVNTLNRLRATDQ